MLLCVVIVFVFVIILGYISSLEDFSIFVFRVTEQVTIWALVLLSLIAISMCDVIRYPFNPQDHGSLGCRFIEAIFAINIGRYLFSIADTVMTKHHIRKIQFRTDLVHHTVAVMCYSFFSAYGENMLLGLIGVLIESTTIFDEIGREFRESEKTNTVWYKRLVIVGGVANIVFRGILPATFLIIAMFHQSPFTMNNITLMVFFLSMIFFAVINVWKILSSIQRFLRYIVDRSHEKFEMPRERIVDRGESRQFKYAKNNLGYLRPYNNKNLAYHNDNEKDNLNNKKDTAKETIKLHLDPTTYFSETKFGLKDETRVVVLGDSFSENVSGHLETMSDFENYIPLRNTQYMNTRNELRTSNNSHNSSDTTGSDNPILLQNNVL